jgi:hypothetical protein
MRALLPLVTKSDPLQSRLLISARGGAAQRPEGDPDQAICNKCRLVARPQGCRNSAPLRGPNPKAPGFAGGYLLSVKLNVRPLTASPRNSGYVFFVQSMGICWSGLMFEQVCIREITTKLPDGSLWAERWQLACGIWWLISRQRIGGPRIAAAGASRLLIVPGGSR